jgi:hypothetical protein
MQYRIVWSHRTRDMQDMINGLLSEGWKLHGSLAMVIEKSQIYFGQAMINEVDIEEEEDSKKSEE